MTEPALPVRDVVAADLPALHALIERGYRSGAAGGWTHEADLFDGPRTDLASLAAMLAVPRQHIRVHGDDGDLRGCVLVADAGDGLAYMGLLCVDPSHQAAGLGRRLIAIAEADAVARYGCTRLELTVIDRREELIAYYRRRGYAPTGERRPLHGAAVPPRVPVSLVALAKTLVPQTLAPKARAPRP